MGFTLVELAIVLVIIGFLIAGVLVAQSMINTTKINQTISLFRQYHVAAIQFREVYKYWPGDFPNTQNYFSGGGNGDDKAVGSNYENYGFFHHLQAAGFMPTKFSYTVDASTANAIQAWSGKVIPDFGIKGAGGAMYDTSSHGIYTTFPQCQNAIRVGTYQDASSMIGWPIRDLYRGGAFSPVDALAIEKKIDDQLPDAGNFLAVTVWPGICRTNNSTGPYVTGSNDKGCMVFYCFNEDSLK